MKTMHGTAQLWMTWVSPDPVASKSTFEVQQDARGRIVALDYTWEFEGQEQRGHLSVEPVAHGAEVTVHWKDSWHAGEGMELKGAYGERLDVLGSYPAPPGPNWGWRIVVRNQTSWEVEMLNISPEGQADRAFLLTYPT